ncbi:DUF2796 domain-containing protein [Pseudooceanicola sp. LIPI14-2-Ac024]|uniref:zinc uptake protein ZrgA n=1 Tax=Pseudooceanicola sp. LIPI14-2-Ac024 TaxID=3344875 RepID=UPI0035D08EAA
MKPAILTVATLAFAAPLAAQEHREAGAHEHGVSQLDIAIEGNEVAMELHAPGADIVGFEHPAESDADKAAIANALAMLAKPLTLFVPSEAAGCVTTSAEAGLEAEEHDHEEHAEGEDHDHEEHDHEEHAEGEDHDDEEGGHSEFHAAYTLTCDDPAAVSELSFAYFDAFPNAQEVEVQLVSDSGATAFEVTRDDPVLRLGN